MVNNELLLQQQKEEEERRRLEQQNNPNPQMNPLQQNQNIRQNQNLQQNLNLQQEQNRNLQTNQNQQINQQLDRNIPIVQGERIEEPDEKMQENGENLSVNPPLAAVRDRRTAERMSDNNRMFKIRRAMQLFEEETNPRKRKEMLEDFLKLCKQYSAQRFVPLEGEKGQKREGTMRTVIGQAQRKMNNEEDEDKPEGTAPPVTTRTQQQNNNNPQNPPPPVTTQQQNNNQNPPPGPNPTTQHRQQNNNQNPPPNTTTQHRQQNNNQNPPPPTNDPVLRNHEQHRQNNNTALVFDDNLFRTRTIRVKKYGPGKNGTKNDLSYNVEIKKPTTIKEALDLRKKLAKYDANDLDGDAQMLYIALSDALQTARSNNEYQPDPAHLVLADPATVPDVETAVMLRDRVLNGWFYAELSQAEKDAYDYYNEIVKERIRQRDELEKVTEHRLRPIPADTVMLPMDLLKQTYEPQVGGSNDCWSCAAAGILNQYLHKDAANKYTAQGIRNYNPAFLDKMPDGMEPDAFEEAKADISKYTTANRNVNRVGSPQGNPFEIADFYMQEFARTPGMQNTCVRHKSFLVSSAYKRAQGLEGPDKKDSAAYQNMKAEFVTSIVEALRKGSAVAMLVSGHYTTIVGITRGSVLKVHNSYPPKDPTQVEDKNLDEIFIGSGNQSAIELTWFDQVTPELTGQFSDLAYDEQTKTYSSKSKITSENVAQKNGVIARKTPVELPEDMRGLIQEDVYVPRQIANNQA